MPVKGIEKVNKKLQLISDGITGRQLEAALYAAGAHGAGNASLMTPVDTSVLINSQFIKTEKTATGYSLKVGYTANYAAAVHSFSGKLKGQPREHFGKTGNQSEFGPQRVVEFGGGSGKGNYWDPNAEPEFLTKAFTGSYGKEVEQVFYKGMKI